MTAGARRYFAGLLLGTALLALALVTWPNGDASAPAGSISDPAERVPNRNPRPDVTSQPTILNAETAASPNSIRAPVTLPATAVSPRPMTGSEPAESPPSLDPAPTEFLTIPSLDPLHRR